MKKEDCIHLLDNNCAKDENGWEPPAGCECWIMFCTNSAAFRAFRLESLDNLLGVSLGIDDREIVFFVAWEDILGIGFEEEDDE